MIPQATTAIVVVLMVITIVSDLRSMRIPNWLSYLGIAAFVGLLAWTLPFPEVAWRVGIAFATLVVGFVLFALNTLGAGDVKILSVLMLFVPSAQIAPFMFTFAAAMIGGIAVVLLARRWLQSPSSSWAFLRNEKRLPMGLSIGAAGLLQVLMQ